MTDPIEASPRRRRGSAWNSCDGCEIPDLPCDGCDGCDVPACSMFRISLFSALALTVPSRPPRRGPSAPARAGVAAIRGYQRWLSPRLSTVCRHTPTCSRYGAEAIHRYGLVTGSRLTVGRISRCNVTTPRGTVDPVP